MLNAIRSEIMNPRNWNQEKLNLPQEELNSLKELMKLQKERVFIIKAAYKGARIVILYFAEYMNLCYDHLLSSVPIEKQDKAPEMYYKAVNKFALEEAKGKILNAFEEALEKQII